MEALPSDGADLVYRGLAFGLLGIVVLSVLIGLVYRAVIARLMASAAAESAAAPAIAVDAEPMVPAAFPVGQAEVIWLASRRLGRRATLARRHGRPANKDSI